MAVQPAGPVGPTGADAPVKVNGKQDQGWRHAREAFRSLKNKSKPRSVQQMLTLVASLRVDDFMTCGLVRRGMMRQILLLQTPLKGLLVSLTNVQPHS
jgi:hypothetical protein